MTATKGESDDGGALGSVRLTISIPREHYERLEQLAAQMKVSRAWVIRDALEGYLARPPAGQRRRR